MESKDTKNNVEQHGESAGAKGETHQAGSAADPLAQAAKPKPKAARRPLVFAAVIVCSVIMVGSFLLPSLSAIISGVQNTVKENSATTAAATTDAATTEEAQTTNTQLEQVDSTYSSKTEGLEAKLDETDEASDAATLINLGNTYYTWATQAKTYASTEDEESHVSELYTKAQGYYDRYLALEDASAARVGRIMCQYYLGDTAGAIAALEEFCASVDDYAPAWADLGKMYEDEGETEKATDAYNKALDADPDNKYGQQSTVNSALSALTADASTDDASTGNAE